ncbi:MAG: phosphatase PAP2 family protein [Geminicoccaceae bacterium]
MIEPDDLERSRKLHGGGRWREALAVRLARLRVLWKAKLVLSTMLPVWILVPYAVIQRWPIVPVNTYAECFLDRLVGFDPDWVWVYVSAYLLVPIPLWLVTTTENLRLYVRGVVWICIISWAFFVVHPVQGPRPDPISRSNLLFDLIVRLDRPINSFPSLHISVASYTLLLAGRIRTTSTAPAERRLWLVIGWLWLTLIAYATLATKQHFVADVVAGFGLSLAVAYRLMGKGLVDRRGHTD